MADSNIQRRHPYALSDLPVAAWAGLHSVTFSGTAGRNSAAILTATNICSIRVVGGAAFFKQGDVTVNATANFADSVYIADTDGWIDVTTFSAKYVSFIQAAGSAAVQAQIVERA